MKEEERMGEKSNGEKGDIREKGRKDERGRKKKESNMKGKEEK